MVPGHEIAGVVSAVGDGVTRYKVGDRVGVGCMVDSCGECEFCKDGQEQFCVKGAVFTYNGKGVRRRGDQGGYSQQVVVSERFAVRIPDGLGLDAPRRCSVRASRPTPRSSAGGTPVPDAKVAIVGLGGLGHMGVKFAAALGAEVTVLSQATGQGGGRRAFGAVDYRATKDEATFKDLRGAFDLIINTVSADLPFDSTSRCSSRTARSSTSACRPSRSSSTFGALIGGEQGRSPAPTSVASRRPRRCSTSRRARHRRRDRDDRRRPGRRGLRPRREVRRALPLRHRHRHHRRLTGHDRWARGGRVASHR